jgi:hypothetical protein
VERLGERMGVFFPVLALTGCALAMDAPTSRWPVADDVEILLANTCV